MKWITRMRIVVNESMMSRMPTVTFIGVMRVNLLSRRRLMVLTPTSTALLRRRRRSSSSYIIVLMRILHWSVRVWCYRVAHRNGFLSSRIVTFRRIVWHSFRSSRIASKCLRRISLTSLIVIQVWLLLRPWRPLIWMWSLHASCSSTLFSSRSLHSQNFNYILEKN